MIVHCEGCSSGIESEAPWAIYDEKYDIWWCNSCHDYEFGSDEGVICYDEEHPSG